MDIGEWLRGLGLAQYEPAFRETAIDDSILPSTTVALSGTSVGAWRGVSNGIS
jgi:hypothetical protein